MIERYEDLPLGVYNKISDLVNAEGKEDLEIQVGIISLLSGKSEEEILGMSLEEYSDMAKKTLFLKEPNKAVPKIRKNYRVGDFILCPVDDYQRLTAGQYIDFQHYTQAEGLDFVGLLSVLLVPKGCKYNEGYDMVDVRNAIADTMSVPDAMALTAFFFKKFVRLIKDSLTSSKREVRRMKGARRKEMEMRIASAESLMRLIGVG